LFNFELFLELIFICSKGAPKEMSPTSLYVVFFGRYQSFLSEHPTI
jgi:hypothetical protein